MTQIFFPGGTQSSWIITEITGGGGYDEYPLEWKFQGGGGFKQKCPSWVGGIDIFWNYTIWGSINCSIWTQSCIIIVEKVTKKQSWHSLQDQGSAAISLAKPLHWHIYWLTQIESVGIWIYMNVLNYVGRKCYKTQRSILHTFLLRNLKRQCNWLQPMISHTYYLPTLISAPFNLFPQQSPLLSIFTSATGSTRPRSTLHQGLFSSLVCVHLLMSVSLFPSTALLDG